MALITERRDPLAREVPGWLGAGLVLGAVATTLWLEKQRPLRRRTESKVRRDVRNLMVTLMAALAIRVTEKPVTDRLSRLVHERRWGLVKRWRLPVWLEVVAAVVLLDYLLYVWHVLTHRVALLWRFHRVHHSDLDLSASTALRFHFVEMILSVPWRAMQIVVVGASPLALSAWQTMTMVAILFHHSNIALPMRLERWLCRLVMTPRMHGIHHSIVEAETNSNWSTIFSWPDYLHRTQRLNVPQQRIRIGVPEARTPAELTLRRLVRMPFWTQPPWWRLPDGMRPQPEWSPSEPRSRLLK